MKIKMILILSLLLISACSYQAKTVRYYDEDCGAIQKKFVLTKTKLNLMTGAKSCHDDECKKMLLVRVVGAPFVGPISAIISGTITVVGNTVYWLQRKVQCD